MRDNCELAGLHFMDYGFWANAAAQCELVRATRIRKRVYKLLCKRAGNHMDNESACATIGLAQRDNASKSKGWHEVCCIIAMQHQKRRRHPTGLKSKADARGCASTGLWLASSHPCKGRLRVESLHWCVQQWDSVGAGTGGAMLRPLVAEGARALFQELS